MHVRRKLSNNRQTVNVVFIIPTGLGCDIGGHAGDAAPAARLIAETCDKLILHPNVVNASDINEMAPNALYVEGSMLDRFLEGKTCLKEVRSNKILVLVNPGVSPDVINAVAASRATLGVDATIEVLGKPFKMKGWVENGFATGEHSGLNHLIVQAQCRFSYNALAVITEINVDEGVALEYFKTGGVNPWGGIEAIVSRKISDIINKPVAHAPVESQETKDNPELLNIAYTKILDPRIAAEACSMTYLHCVLKGLQRAPRPSENGISVDSVGCLVTPTGCVGRPHKACIDRGIPIIAVKENDSHQNQYDERIIYVDNYVEAAGMISLLKSGVTLESVTRIQKTEILNGDDEED